MTKFTLQEFYLGDEYNVMGEAVKDLFENGSPDYEERTGKLTRRSAELEKLYIKIHEDKALEKISEEQFQILWNSHATEQSEIKSKLPTIENQIETLKNKMCDTQQFIEKAKKYTDMTELTGKLLRAFIDKIVVGERDKITKKQEIWIYYNHIGLRGVKPNTKITKISQETETTDTQIAEKIAV